MTEGDILVDIGPSGIRASMVNRTQHFLYSCLTLFSVLLLGNNSSDSAHSRLFLLNNVNA